MIEAAIQKGVTGMDAIKCKTCDRGTLTTQRKYRMSGIVVLIGFILLIPSVLGILFGVIGLVGSGSVASSSGERSRTEAITTLQAAKVPGPVISRLTSFKRLAVSDTAGLTSRQRAAVRSSNLTLTTS